MKWNELVELYIRVQLENNLRLKHEGLNLLKENREVAYLHISDYIMITHSAISSFCALDEGGTTASSPLTNLSSTIGREIMETFGPTHRNADWKKYLQLGDLMLEVFLANDLISLSSPPPRSREPVKVIIDHRWPTDLPESLVKRGLRGTWSVKPEDVKGPTQTIQFNDESIKVHKKVVKRWNETLDGSLMKMKDSVWMDAVNKLQQTPWTIKDDVLNAVLKDPSKFFSASSKTEENLSKKIDYEYITAKASALAGHTFYMAADLDYRGRIYFVESFLNFQGSDLARGLLTFGESKPVDASGFKWMKIHTASSFNQSYSISDIPKWCEADYKSHLQSEGLDNISVDKMTLNDRVRWVDNNLDLIRETAEEGIIQDCEKPVAFLAAAIEVSNYLESDGVYESSLPIPIDGSNNGWQHLGAISKDPQTGLLVGLVPVAIQNDFYVQTAKRLIELTKDADRKSILESMPMKAIRKAISKRGSMTRAYSAGAQKIAENMYQDCKSAGYTVKYGITEKHCKGFARDLVKAISDVCPGPLSTMKYLQELAADRLDQGWNYLTWDTPAGFHVVYENYHTDTVKFRNRIRGLGTRQDKIQHVLQLKSTIPDRRGFMCGISPNFIHSQDASHMQTVISRFNGCFGAVHDSFSAHASDVDRLCGLTKEVFIEMYDKPNYFNNIAEALEADAEQPVLGNLTIKDVEGSDFFFA